MCLTDNVMIYCCHTDTGETRQIPPDQRTATPYLTKYEKARVVGTRALQIRCVVSCVCVRVCVCVCRCTYVCGITKTCEVS